MLIDLHVHARERSCCATNSEQEMIRAARAAGLGAIVFADHDALAPRERISELNEEFAPFRVFGGIELSVTPQDHVLVIGVRERLLVRRRWSYADLRRFAHERGGFVIIAHPFRYRGDMPPDVIENPPDALELRSANIEPANEPMIRALAARLGCGLVCNSDAHWARALGAHFNVLDREPADEDALAGLLRAGAYVCGSEAGGRPSTSSGRPEHVKGR